MAIYYIRFMKPPETGSLLIADPFMKDPNFMRSVVFLCEHRAEGSFGFVLNRPLRIKLGELIPELEGFDIPVYFGGPVQTDTIHFLHQVPDQIPGGFEVVDGVFWGGDFALLTTLISNKTVDIGKLRFYLGYSGWGEKQLENEMKEKSWLTTMGLKQLIFHHNFEEIWKDALSHMGNPYAQMVNYPLDPQLN
jgi:putative transcriptional regulator